MARLLTLIIALTQSYYSNIYATVTYSVVLTLGQLILVVSAQLQQQSPINIDTGAISQNLNLNPLAFNNQYDVPVSGDFVYTGITMKFVPDSGPPATLTTHQGMYDLQRVVFHWGSTSAMGSEHQVDGDQFAAEIQFVHLKHDVAGDTYSIVAVRCNAVPGEATGVWRDLLRDDPTSDRSLKYADLLPPTTDREYYQYKGSHTTPPYTENVQWYVMQKTIRIPKVFLASLRVVQISNFRPVQPLNGRSVFESP